MSLIVWMHFSRTEKDNSRLSLQFICGTSVFSVFAVFIQKEKCFSSYPFTQIHVGLAHTLGWLPQLFRVNVETYNLRGATMRQTTLLRNPSCDFHHSFIWLYAWESSNTDYHLLIECILELESVIEKWHKFIRRPLFLQLTLTASVYIASAKRWQNKIAPPLKPWTRPRIWPWLKLKSKPSRWIVITSQAPTRKTLPQQKPYTMIRIRKASQSKKTHNSAQPTNTKQPNFGNILS